MASNDSLSRRETEDDERSTSSTISTQPSRQQQRLEAALSDLESSFDRESHSIRYTSHVLDVGSDGSEELDDLSSISSRRSSSTNTAQWFLNEMQNEGQRRGNVCDLDISQSSPEMVDLWKRKQQPTVDQSVNLMDTKAAKYEEPVEQISSLHMMKSGLQNFCMPVTSETKMPLFAFPALGSNQWGEKESKVRKSKIRDSKSKKKDNEDDPTRITNGWHRAIGLLLVTFFLAVVAVASGQSSAKKSHPLEGEGIVTAVQSAAQEEMSNFQSKNGDDDEQDNSFAVFEAAANASTLQALVAAEKNESQSASHTYEVTNEEIIFRPTVTLPAKTKARALLAILLEFQLATPTELLQPNQHSAAHRAIKWMAEDDPAELTLPSFYYQPPHTATMSRHDEETEGWKDDTFSIQQVLQRYVLALFWFSLVAPSDGTKETMTEDVVAAENKKRFQKSWLSADHVCHWRGVDCGTYGHGDRAGVESIHMSTVVTVNLTRHNLVGTLPPQWFSGTALPDLTILDLSHNYLYGSLGKLLMAEETGSFKITTRQGEYDVRFPSNWSKVSSFSTESELLHFDIAHNQLTGTLSPLLRQMKHCHNLFLNHNQFKGPLKSFLGDGIGQGKLEQLDVGNNLITGTIPSSLADLKRLQFLSLESNFFSGSLPEIFDGLEEIVELNVNDNILEGGLPETLGETKNIERVELNHNEISGSFPSSWESITTLQRLSVHHNAINGEIPTFFGSTMQQLSDLSLQNNQLRGSIPSELGLCTNLERLYLEENFFRGTPPASLGNLRHLEKLRLSGNRLSGTLPAPICDLLEKYQLIYLSSDCKSGHIQCGCCHACF